MSDSIFSLLFPKRVGIFCLYIISNYSFEIEGFGEFKMLIFEGGLKR